MELESIFKSITFRFVAVGVLIFGLLLPMLLLFLLLSDRETYYQQAQTNVGQSWGLPQTITGPVLLFRAGDRRFNHYLTPSRLDVNVTSDYEYRDRGIYEIPVFTTQIEITGSFGLDSTARLPQSLRRDNEVAYLFLAISDIRGVRSAVAELGKEVQQFHSTREPSGVSAIELPFAAEQLDQSDSFKISINLRFTERLGIVLTGNQSTLNASSTWPHPSFDGRFLPDERSVRPDGFSAAWSSTSLSRGFPSVIREDQWEGVIWSEPSLSRFNRSTNGGSISESAYSVGFSVVDPVTPYRLTLRALKYGVMFIVLSLVSVLCIELILKRRFHIVQYGVVGIGLVIFYLVLLSLSELATFSVSYVIASLVLTGMISAYSWFIHRDPKITTVILLVLTLLYIVMYVVLSMQDYALVVGSALTLLLLAMLMYATRTLHLT